jgi:hypothetical protein
MSEDQKNTIRELLKNLRSETDRVIKMAQNISGDVIQGRESGREVSLAITKLQEAKMWLGQGIGELGEEFKLPEQFRDEAK